VHVGCSQRPFCLVMELVDGPGGVNNLFLLLHLKEEQLPPHKMLRIAKQVASVGPGR